MKGTTAALPSEALLGVSTKAKEEPSDHADATSTRLTLGQQSFTHKRIMFGFGPVTNVS